MKVLVSDVPHRRFLEPLPAGVALVAEPEPDVEFVLLGPELAQRLPGLFGQLPRLRVVQSTQAGVDWLLPAVPEGIVVCSASGAHDIPVAEWVVAVLLALRRHLPEFLERQQRRDWDLNANELTATGPSPVRPVNDLEGASVLILGYGAIGHAVAARLAPFGARVVGIARQARADTQPPEALPRLLPEADAVILLLPLTPETERIVDATFLAQMKPDAILINAGRGRLVDTEALLAALRARRIRAALDVTDPEPLPADHPLWQAPNVLITPHVAGSTARWQERAYRLAGEQLRRYAAGEPLMNIRSGHV